LHFHDIVKKFQHEHERLTQPFERFFIRKINPGGETFKIVPGKKQVEGKISRNRAHQKHHLTQQFYLETARLEYLPAHQTESILPLYDLLS
jgi:hypothetical protein